jgi:F0F1-type ATP synthase membrane subunit b/b'
VAAILVVVVLGVTTTALLLVVVLALIRHLKALGAALGRFHDEVTPALEEIRRGQIEAQERMEAVDRLRSANDGLGSRIRS